MNYSATAISYEKAVESLLKETGVEHSTMMKHPCLRFKGGFFTMMFEKENALIIKVSPERVQELILSGQGRAFDFTKRPFKEWVLIPDEFENQYESYMREALQYVKDNLV